MYICWTPTGIIVVRNAVKLKDIANLILTCIETLVSMTVYIVVQEFNTLARNFLRLFISFAVKTESNMSH